MSIGRSTTSGDVWARYYDAKISTARVEVEQAVADLKAANEDLATLASGSETGSIPDKQIVQAKRLVHECQRRERIAEAHLAELEAAKALVLSLAEERRSVCINV
jgi:hypothetical protein